MRIGIVAVPAVVAAISAAAHEHHGTVLVAYAR
jgi:hypothetical protein